MAENDRRQIRPTVARRETVAGAFRSTTDQLVRDTPRVSVHALSEYLTADAARRRAIVEEQKRPKDFRVIWYARAERAIAGFLATGGNTAAPLDAAVRELRNQRPTTAPALRRRDTCLQAIESFRRSIDKLDLDFSGFKRSGQKFEAMNLAGVSVSVRPELLVTEASGRVVGAGKLYFSKADPLKEDRAGYLTTVLHQFVEEDLGAGAQANASRSFVLDVFPGRVWRAPGSFSRRRRVVSAACAELALTWATV